MGKAVRYESCAGTPLPRVTPESAGAKAEWVEEMIDGFEKAGLRIHSFILVRDGKVFAEGYYRPYGPSQYQTVYSMSKSFLSAAVGIAEGEGLISPDEHVAELFAREIREAGVVPGPELRALTLRHLLRMSTGQAEEKWEYDFVPSFLSQPFSEMPGEVFRYNTMATYMCSAALKKHGVDLGDYLQEKLFGPMGIRGPHWLRTDSGLCTAGYGLSLLPEIIAKFGVLVLQDGMWEGKRLIPAEYLRRATSRQIDTSRGANQNPDWRAGYGYQFWMSRNGSFRASGMFGQTCVMNREKNTVMALTGLLDDMQRELDVCTESVFDRICGAPLPADPEADERLLKKTRGLACVTEPVPDGGKLPALLRLILSRRPEKSGRKFDAALDGDDLLLKTPLTDAPLRASRGAFLRQEADFHLHLMHSGIDAVSEAYAGYGLRDRALIIRLFIPEALLDLRVELRMARGRPRILLYDVHDPKAPKRVEKIPGM